MAQKISGLDKTSGILGRIVERKIEEVGLLKSRFGMADFLARARDAAPPRGFASAVERKTGSGRNALIAEIKKASPSKGLIRPDFDPPKLARALFRGGAACLSVLTDETFFQGRPDFIAQAREACPLPVLRKDFCIDPIQCAQARALGADCVLLICALAEKPLLQDLEGLCESLGMDCLIEVKSEADLDKAAGLNGRLCGVNNRDLSTFEVDFGRAGRLAPLLEGKTVVAESGVKGKEDLKALNKMGIRAFLVGEALMRQSDVQAAAEALLCA